MHAIPLALRPASSLPLLLLRGGASPSAAAALPLLLLRGGALPPTTFEMNAATQDFIMQATLYIGTLMSALSGCISAGTKQMDLFGCVVVGSLTAIGGCTLRDVMLDRPPFWLAYTAHLHLCVWFSVACFVAWPWIVSSGFKDTHLAFLWSDAIGMAASTVIGAHIGYEETNKPVVAVMSGVITATFGGIGRDVLCLEPPRALYAERSMYATPALLGAMCYVGLTMLRSWLAPRGYDLPQWLVASAPFFLALLVRAAAWTYRLALPRWARKSSFGFFHFGDQYKVEMSVLTTDKSQ